MIIYLKKVSLIRCFFKINYRRFSTTLPRNEETTYKSKKIASWAYWIGVGKEANEAWAKNVKAVKALASGAANYAGYGPLGGLAVGAVTDLVLPTLGEDIAYWFIPDQKNALLFMENKEFMGFDKGKGIAAYAKNSTKKQGTFFIGLYNDNQMLGIDVNVKVAVVWEINHYEDRQYKEMIVSPLYEKKVIREPIITTSTILVTAEDN